MAVLPIRKYGDSLLKKTSKRVGKIDKEIKKLISDMIETLHSAGGIGLAAPQVGVLKRIIIADIPGGENIILINPEIIKLEGEIEGEEGCLSLPGIVGEVVRAERVFVHGEDVDGIPKEIKAEGLFARVLQHEVDHLDGILFIDRMDTIKRKALLRELKQLRKAMKSQKREL
jgi:peptide deformylase